MDKKVKNVKHAMVGIGASDEQAKSELAAIVASSGDAIIGKTLDGIITSWNQGATKMFGYQFDEIIGRSITLIIPPEFRKEEDEIRAKIQKGNSISNLETERVTKNGKRLFVSSSISPIKNAKHKIIGISNITRDITKERRGRELINLLAEASKELSSSLDYKTTLTTITRLAVPKIADWCTVNIKTEKGIEQLAISHIDPEKVKWAKEISKSNLLDSDAPSGSPYVLRTGKSEFTPEITDAALVAYAKNDEQLVMLRNLQLSSVMTVPIIVKKEPIGTITFVSAESGYHYTKTDLSIAEEIANRAALAIENARLFAEEQKAVRLRDEFISVASHELKTPITSLKMYTQVLQKQFEKRGELEFNKHFFKIDDQINKLTALLNNLLNVAKLQHGRLEFALEDLDLDELARETVEILQTTTSKHTIKIVGKIGKKVYADRYRIYQVLTNLLTNAIKYSPNADSIIVHLAAKKDHVVVSVQDFGIGINKEQQKKIFHKFYRVASPKEITFPGLGMGLYIASEIIKRHHGIMRVVSNKGKGSIISFTLPYQYVEKKSAIL